MLCYLNTKKIINFVFIFAVSLIISTLLFLRTEIMDFTVFIGFGWDHHKYITMAQEIPLKFNIAPFCWRIATPLISKFLPLSIPLNFFLINFLGIVLTGTVIYFLILKLPYIQPDKIYAFTGMAMYFSLQWATQFLMYDYCLTDSLSLLVITLLIYSLFSKNDLLFFIFLTLGVTIKENIIFAAPLYYTFNTEKVINLPLLKRTLLLTLPAIAVLFLLRYFIPQMNTNVNYINTLPEVLRLCPREPYNYSNVFNKVFLNRIEIPLWKSLYTYTFSTFGIMLIILPVFALKKYFKLFLRFAPFAFLVYSQLMFATNTERLLVMAFPAAIILAVYGIDEINKKTIIKPFWILIANIAVLAYTLLRFAKFSDKIL